MGAQFELPLKNGAMLGAAVQMKIKKEAKIVKNLGNGRKSLTLMI